MRSNKKKVFLGVVLVLGFLNFNLFSTISTKSSVKVGTSLFIASHGFNSRIIGALLCADGTDANINENSVSSVFVTQDEDTGVDEIVEPLVFRLLRRGLISTSNHEDDHSGKNQNDDNDPDRRVAALS